MVGNPTDRHGTCTTQHSCNSKRTHPEINGSHWTNSSSGGDDKLVQETTMTDEHVCGVVGGEAVTRGMFHTCQT